MKKIAVIKFGGEVAESPSDLQNLAYSLKILSSDFHILLVHGGGPYATKLSDRLGIQTEMVGGRRITSPKTLEVMMMSLPGVISSTVLATLVSSDLPVVPLSGIGLVEVVKRPPKRVSGSDEIIDFGLVGDITKIQTSSILHLFNGSYIPLLSPLSSTKEGTILNVNADSVASKVALALKADIFVSITKVGAIFQDISNSDSRFANLTIESTKAAIKDGLISGGMIPKVEESYSLLEQGLKAFHIVGLDKKENLIQELKFPGSLGTCITL